MDHSFLLQTKFLVPRHRGELIPRPDLLLRLETALDKRLILLSAPPGYGKTVLLSELAAHTQRPFAWYQLDAADGDPTIFLSYLIACLRNIQGALLPGEAATVGSAAVSLLDDSLSGTTISPDHILHVLINEITAAIVDDWLIILEDYHLITNPDVHMLVQTLLDKGPPGLHMTISSRTDPPLSLARLRARGDLAEYRAPELRFDQAEVEQWLAQAVPGMTEENARQLNEKTEGWAAALQIILSSLAGQDIASASRFIDELSGTQRFIFEYLAEEVLQQLPPERQRFLTHTAVLDQMNAAICNVILGSDNAQLMLDSLEQDNLFIVSLDEKREWYRYHHLFREFLLAKLRRESPGTLQQLEQSAANTYLNQGAVEVAFVHYVRAQDFDAAAQALARFAREYVERRRIAVLQRYLGDLPEDVVQRYPELLLQHGNVLWRLGRFGAALSRYEDAQTAFAVQEDNNGVCRVLTQMAELARFQGNYRQARTFASEALFHVPQEEHASQAKALMALAKSEGFLSGMDRGRELAEESVAAARRAGDGITPLARANLLRALGRICWWHGDPQATLRYCQEALESVSDRYSPIAATVYITMAIPYVYRRDLDTAQSYAELGLEIAQQLQLPAFLPRAYMTLGSILTRRGEWEQAEAYLRQAMDQSQGMGLESYARVMATGYLAQNLCVQGRIEEARQLAEGALWERAANPDTYEMVVCRSVLADVALDSGELEEAEAIFSGLVTTGQRRQFRIPLAMVYFGLAYIFLHDGRIAEAIEHATKSVSILEPLGTWQLYLDQGERARLVCQAMVQAGRATPFVNQVLQRLPDTATHTAVRVQCLGPFCVFIGEEEVTQTQWVSTKARDLLAYFVTHRRQHVTLARVAEAIWPELGSQKRAFHSALYRLRHALRQEGQNTKFILAKGGEYWLDTEQFQIDVDSFEAAVSHAHTLSGAESLPWYEKALNLYQGGYLDNLLYYDWAEPERHRLQKIYLETLCRLATGYAEQQQYEKAIIFGEKAVAEDPYHEANYCDLMRYYAMLGDKATLVRQYRRLQRVLLEELKVAPALTTQALYKQLLSQVNEAA
ncbi:MAG: tetratricopeptide repeat protein [Anaerolineaceae bacterium]|nr:MAG: tetratricopeptide repeat protein [Anaerolineaceae bacterium]